MKEEKILQASVKALEKKPKKNYKHKDIVITKYETEEEYKDGAKIERRVPKKINITKKINETAKLYKKEQTSAEQKLAELEKVFSK